MKIKIHFILVFGLIFNISKSQIFLDTITLGGNFNTDVYYSLEDSLVASNPSANNWTIGLATMPTVPSIIINGGKGVKLWEVPSNIMDTSNFENTLDISNINQWNRLRDSDTSWYRSAFQQTDANIPPYGWGVFDNSNFEIVGNKVFVIQTQSNEYYKIWILDKILGNYRVKYATLNHSFDTIQTIQASNFIQRNFIFLDLDSRILNNREPLHNDWDLLFSQYESFNGDIVVGIKSNTVNKTFNSNEFKGISIAVSNTLPENASFQNLEFSYKINTIGNNWYNEENVAISLLDSLTYFIKKDNGDIYKFWFTSFDGSESSTISFKYEKVASGTTNINTNIINDINIYPNPTNGIVNFKLHQNKDFHLKIYNFNGKLIEEMLITNEISHTNISHLHNGIYFFYFSNEDQHLKKKILLDK